MNASDFIATAALAVSVVGVGLSLFLGLRQLKVNASQHELNERLLAKELAESNAGKKADVSTSFVPHGSKEKRFKVFNRGKAPARNVRIFLVDGNSILIPSQVDSTFPLERLEPHGSVELIASTHLGLIERKFQVKISWDDDIGSHEKVEWPTL